MGAERTSTTVTQKQVLSALKSSGYLFEQEIAIRLEKDNWFVWTNVAFEDQDLGKSRELDVQARRKVEHIDEHNAGVWFEALVECKRFKMPLAFIGRDKAKVDGRHAPIEFDFPIKEYVSEPKKNSKSGGISYTRKSAFDYLGLRDVHWAEKAKDKAVQFCKIERPKKDFIASHAGMFESIILPMAKAISAFKESRRQQYKRGDYALFKVIIPIVVVDCDLYFSNQSDSIDHIERREFVTVRREIKSNSLELTPTITFVHEAYLLSFLNDIVSPLGQKIVDCIKADPDRYLNGNFESEYLAKNFGVT